MHFYRTSHDELFQAVVDKCEEFGLEMYVQTVVTDFEEGVLRAVAGVFGREVQSKVCYYHLMQSTWCKIQQLGLVNHYNDDEDFCKFCGKLDGLTFLPNDEVPEGMAHLKDTAPPEAADLVAYFDKSYVSGSFRMTGSQDDDHTNVRVRHTIISTRHMERS